MEDSANEQPIMATATKTTVPNRCNGTAAPRRHDKKPDPAAASANTIQPRIEPASCVHCIAASSARRTIAVDAVNITQPKNAFPARLLIHNSGESSSGFFSSLSRAPAIHVHSIDHNQAVVAASSKASTVTQT